LAGRIGAGKTTLLLQVLAATRRIKFFASTEETQRDLRRVVTRFGLQIGEVMGVDECRGDLEVAIQRAKEVKPAVAVFDSLQSFADSRHVHKTAKVVERLAEFARDSGIAVIATSHTGKAGGPLLSARASHALDTLLVLDRVPDECGKGEPLRVLRSDVKCRAASLGASVLLKLTETGFRKVV
jgi:predicted ATP-dependent serine protease